MIPRRDRWKWAVLAASSAILALAALEGAARVYYRLGYASLTIPYSASDEERKLAWVARHRRTGIVGSYGYDEYDPLLGWRLRPNLRDFRFANEPPVTSNSDGIRDTREFPRGKPPGVRRLVLAGDSFTFGESGEQNHIWPALLQRDLLGWEVLNLGAHGYGADQAMLALRTKGLAYDPDVAILAVFIEDVFRNAVAFRDYAKPMFVLDGDVLRLTNVPVPRPEALLAQARPVSYAWHLVTHQLGRVYGSTERREDFPYLLRLNRAILTEALRATTAAGVRLLVVVIHFGSPGQPIEESMEQWGRESGCPVLNLRAAFEAAQARGEVMWGAHFSPQGHAVTATAVEEKLRELGWVR